MREAPESADDVPVSFGMVEPGLSEPGVELDREVLVALVLRVGKWQAEEQSQFGIDRVHVPS